MRAFLLCLLYLTLFAGDPPPAKPLPAGVDPIVNEYKDAVTKARAAYEAACAKAQEKALTALDAKNKVIIKRGDVDGAIAVKGVIERIKSGKVREEAEKVAETDLLGVEISNSSKSVIGKWNIFGNGTMNPSVVVIRPDNTVTWDEVNRGIWSLENIDIIMKFDKSSNRFPISVFFSGKIENGYKIISIK